MKRTMLAVVVVLLSAGSVHAEPATPDTLQQAQSAMFQATARYYLLLSEQQQRIIAETAKKDAALARYWGEYVKGVPARTGK